MGRKGSTRIARQEELRATAAALSLDGRFDVAVIGGGAAGLVAAICAAEQGAKTVVLERALECGRTILATGGGRCNFSNRALAPEAYNDAAFAEAVMGDDALERILAFFRESGMAWAEEDGRLYPASFSAASVRDVLLARAARTGVTLACDREVTAVQAASEGFRVALATGESVLAKAAIFAAGGAGTLAIEGLRSRAAQPVLCPIAAAGLPFEALDGRRAHVKATLLRDGKTVASEAGEALFRSFGLSGIVIFNLSRFAREGDEIELDLAPALSQSQFDYLVERAGSSAGIMDPAIAGVLGAQKTVRARVLGLAQTQLAQVTRGGLITSCFDPVTLMAAARPGLFACGEALEIDGPCGGYNLSWAWTSGMVAGTAAAAWAEGCCA